MKDIENGDVLSFLNSLFKVNKSCKSCSAFEGESAVCTDVIKCNFDLSKCTLYCDTAKKDSVYWKCDALITKKAVNLGNNPLIEE